MAKSILSARIAVVKLGALAIEGLLIEDGNFGVAVPQIAAIFPYFQKGQDSQSKASQSLKRLMGEGFKTHRVKTDFNKNATIAVSLEDFVLVVKKLFRKGDDVAEDWIDALVGVSLHQVFCDAFDIEFGKEDRQEYLKSRILDQPDPWKRLFEKEFCDRIMEWFGSQFYWDFVYYWMTPEEQCKLNQLNPVRREANGRCDRPHRIHQFVEELTKEQLRDEIVRLIAWVDAATCKEDFLRLYNNAKGIGKQLPLF